MIAEIRLQNYRSYKDQSFLLSPSLNVVVGPNASGKTNLLESIMVICRGASYRVTDVDLIKKGCSWARIDAETHNDIRVLKLTNNNKLVKEFEIGTKKIKRLGGGKYSLPVVYFEPNHLLMLAGPPELRRNYLDEILAYTIPGFKKSKSDYIKTLRHRNALLKSGLASSSSIFPWNVRLSHLGGLIAQARYDLVSRLNKDIKQEYRGVSGSNESVELLYKPSVDLGLYESLLLNKLEEAFELDVLRGFTVYGPHREDMEILINGRAPALMASRGESRSIIVAMKMIEHSLVSGVSDEPPVVLLDDILSELDVNRRQSLRERLVNGQTIITTTDADALGGTKTANLIYL